MKSFLTSEEAATALGVSLETLYAYVSRGRIRSEPAEAGSRSRRYMAADITALRKRRDYRHSPAMVAAEALGWGAPVLDSALTLVANERLFYRGREATELAWSVGFDQAAALFLGVETAQFAGAATRVGGAFASMPFDWRTLTRQLSPIGSLQVALPYLDALDPETPVISAEAMGTRAADVVSAAVAFATGAKPVELSSAVKILAQSWSSRQAAAISLLNAALILCIDHELNVSSFTARTTTSAGSSAYQAVTAGLAALQGWRHGGMTRRVEILFDRAGDTSINAALREQKELNGHMPGFGHPLYPHGDPRARALLDAVEEHFGKTREGAFVRDCAARGQAQAGHPPTIDFALVAVRRCLRLPSHAGITLFAIARSVGWIGHAAEQARTGILIRPRARYVGTLP